MLSVAKLLLQIVSVLESGDKSGNARLAVLDRCLSLFSVCVGRYVALGVICGGCLIDSGAFAHVAIGLRHSIKLRLWFVAAVGT